MYICINIVLIFVPTSDENINQNNNNDYMNNWGSK